MKSQRNKPKHTICRRCSSRSLIISDRVCVQCGFGRSKKIRR